MLMNVPTMTMNTLVPEHHEQIEIPHLQSECVHIVREHPIDRQAPDVREKILVGLERIQQQPEKWKYQRESIQNKDYQRNIYRYFFRLCPLFHVLPSFYCAAPHSAAPLPFRSEL